MSRFSSGKATSNARQACADNRETPKATVNLPLNPKQAEALEVLERLAERQKALGKPALFDGLRKLFYRD